MAKASQTKHRSPAIERPSLAQAGTIAYRLGAGGDLDVLLIRRRHKRRWGIPKGFIEPGQTARQAAVQEAIEEAGVAGELWPEPIGVFQYAKMGRSYQVVVYPLRVTREYEQYEELMFRQRQWFPLRQALDRKLRKGVRPLLLKLRESITDSPL